MNYTAIESAAYYSDKEIPFVFVTILKTEGSTSRNQGSMVVNPKGQISGTIGGGELEAYALSQALSLLGGTDKYRHLRFTVQQQQELSLGVAYLFLLRCESEQERKAFTTLYRWQMHQLDHVFGLQLQPNVEILGLCEGGATLGNVHPSFIETAKEILHTKKGRFIESEAWTCHLSLPINYHDILLVGGGHVNQAIAEMAHFLGIPTQVVETREEYATKELFAHARMRTIAPTLEEALDQVTTTEYTACVVASHSLGEEAAKKLLERDIAYLGILGSRHKAKKIRCNLQLQQKADERLFCPIGLDLGTETPQEIALSVLAEIMKVFNNRSGRSLKYQTKELVLVRGGGDLATGVIFRLHQAGYRVIVLEVDKPTVIRRTVSVAQAIYEGSVAIEGMVAMHCQDVKHAFSLIEEGKIAVLIDPNLETLELIDPVCLVDAIMAKQNLGTKIEDAPLVIALGPGFTAQVDCDLVIETKRGHSLGRIIREGSAESNTGIPGLVEGFGRERVVHSPCDGIFESKMSIGSLVETGDVIATVGTTEVQATISGKLRGLLNNGLTVTKGFKIADIDPRREKADHTTISDKALCIGGAVLTAVDGFIHKA